MKIKFPLIIVGSQWGDEGKGKVVDLLSDRASHVVRYNGGNNAGHSVVLAVEKFKLSLLPSGVLRRKKLFLSHGVVIDPKILLDEIALFEKRKIKVNLMIDPRVNIVMPYHKALDAATEIWKGKKATGSLHLGIGYTYEDKNNRFGVRFEDLIAPNALKERLELIFPLKKLQIEKVYGQKFSSTIKEIYKEYVNYGKKLKKYLGDVSFTLTKAIKKERVLFEGAHGTFLDGIFGTYPYTTAVYTIAGGVFPYVGLPPQKIYSLGVVKAYTTRVGNGPFPTELLDSTGEKIRQVGGEFGTVSKRPRRCGWLDLCLVRTAIRLSGFDYLAITKLDVLSGLDRIKVCIGYKIGKKTIREVPAMMSDFGKCTPIYKEFKGWKEDISKIKKLEKLSLEAKTYLKYIEKQLEVPVKIISVAAERSSNILL
ncbi:adenylosuccinate synthase [Candidatus Roizmanbacteria bacterium]|nr:adenylosuccinate synthase [Candidatus Roizmanbacteria bacterium]